MPPGCVMRSQHAQSGRVSRHVAKAVIPQSTLSDCLNSATRSETLYHCCNNSIENMFGRLTDWRRLALRDNRCAHTVVSALCLAATGIFWLSFMRPDPSATRRASNLKSPRWSCKITAHIGRDRRPQIAARYERVRDTCHCSPEVAGVSPPSSFLCGAAIRGASIIVPPRRRNPLPARLALTWETRYAANWWVSNKRRKFQRGVSSGIASCSPNWAKRRMGGVS